MRDEILKALLAVMRGREGAPPMPDSMAVKWTPTAEDIADALGPLLAPAAKAGDWTDAEVDEIGAAWRKLLHRDDRVDDELRSAIRGVLAGRRAEDHFCRFVLVRADEIRARRIAPPPPTGTTSDGRTVLLACTPYDYARPDGTCMIHKSASKRPPLTETIPPSSDDPRQTAAYRDGAALAARVRDGAEVDRVRARAVEAVAKGHRWDAADVKRAMEVQPGGGLARMVDAVENALREGRDRASPSPPPEVLGVLAVATTGGDLAALVENNADDATIATTVAAVRAVVRDAAESAAPGGDVLVVVEARRFDSVNGMPGPFVNPAPIRVPVDAPERVTVAILAPGSDVAHAAGAIGKVKALLDEADKVHAPIVSVDALRAVLGK